MCYMLQIMFQVMTVATYMHIAINETIYVYLHAWHVYHCIMDLSTYIKTHDSESRGQEEAAIIRETKIT